MNRNTIATLTIMGTALALSARAEEIDRTLAERKDELGGTTFSAEGLERIESWAGERGYETLLAVRHQQPLSFYRDDPTQCGCHADLDCDGTVGTTDLVSLVAQWGSCELCSADVDDDGQIGVLDLIGLIVAWGVCAD